MKRGLARLSTSAAAASLILAFCPAGGARAEGDPAAPVGASPVSFMSAAAELTRQGKEHAEKGDDAVAIRRFVEAIQLDGGYGPAYLELAALRERMGDWVEAEHTYDIAIERVAGFAAAFRARAALHARLGQSDRQLADLEAAARLAETPDTLRELAQRYIESKAWPAALAVYRRYGALAERLGDERAVRDASVHARALSILAAELDPVAFGASSSDWVRRAEASVARRLGM
jgi:tetratricopeptide (TPR) repeat protein